ncbi:hypothetical protein GGS24DRAFT_456017 [Hypoxylon argillaceum]|nr:hypothetical protein GGS24DRAFT_456017 [Hypoxylon argillaceum]
MAPAMGNLKARIKATLLRRDSKRLSPTPSKNGSGRDYTSSVSTQSQPGYDASDERSDHKVRGGSGKSLSQEPAVNRSGSRPLEDNSRSSNSNSKSNGNGNDNSNDKDTTSQIPAPDGDALASGSGFASASASAHGDRPQNKAGPRCPQTHGTEDSDLQAEGTNSSTAAIQARSGNDLHCLATNSRAGSATTTTTTAPTSIASPTTTAAAAPAVALAATTTATTTTTATATSTIAANTAATIATATAAAGTSAVLPSIHEHPATPPTLPSTNPDSEVTLPDPRATIASADLEQDIIASPIDDPLINSSLLTPPTTSSFRPPLSPSFPRPLGPQRRQSILPAHQTNIVHALLHGHTHDFELDIADPDLQDPLSGMVTRKIWVKRPMASATLIIINEEDLVDDVREQILRKYANSLGRQYDAPDLTLRICNWEQQTSRPLQPDEPICKVIDSYYANGQTVDQALLIDIPSRRTPKASPNPKFYADDRPHESGTDYFPPYPPLAHSHHSVTSALLNGQHSLHFPPSMSIVGGNQLPPLPSPGGTRRLPTNRPGMQRMHTASPVSTVPNNQIVAAPTGTHKYPRPVRSRTHSGASSDQSIHPPAAPPIPTPPPVERTATPPPRVASPRPSLQMKKKRTIEPPSLLSGLLDTAVPPINILIVEDNMINLRLLEAFVKRLKVRWQTAVNGREAVDKWRVGGFHLVLMDIQLPIMNGLEATREIRRIEKVNSIGVFSSSASSPPDEVLPEPAEEDKLANTEMFKSPVIIVALTASSLQSDRHEALAAGCNDFLTKPVDFNWLQRKVKEWGCMQALIDFNGWRKWKDFSQKTQAIEAAKKTAGTSKAKPVKKNRLSMAAAA